MDILKDKDFFKGTLMVENSPYRELTLLNSKDITYTPIQKFTINLKSSGKLPLIIASISVVIFVILFLFSIRLFSTIKRIKNRKKRGPYLYN